MRIEGYPNRPSRRRVTLSSAAHKNQHLRSHDETHQQPEHSPEKWLTFKQR
jgi:hypothetical protein